MVCSILVCYLTINRFSLYVKMISFNTAFGSINRNDLGITFFCLWSLAQKHSDLSALALRIKHRASCTWGKCCTTERSLAGLKLVILLLQPPDGLELQLCVIMPGTLWFFLRAYNVNCADYFRKRHLELSQVAKMHLNPMLVLAWVLNKILSLNISPQ